MSRPFEEVTPQVDVDALEREILAYWEEKQIFAKSLAQNKDKPLFSFYDGPPYATGKPHYGHVLQSALKDTVLRYKTMQGYYVPRRVGWDTHGLPVEVLVEKELGLKTKKDVEKYGIEAFNQKCREVVFRYIDEFTTTLKRLGRWADYEHAYATLDRDYMESEWWVFKQLWDQGLVYRDFRSTPYCIRCETPLSNFEVSMAYKDKTDLAVYVRLSVVGHDKLDLLVWTTTPWTLPGNVAVAVNAALHYVSVEYEGRELVVARERIPAVFGNTEMSIVREWAIEELQQLHYEPLYDTGPAEKHPKLYGIVLADHVTAEEGTGLVHMAPAFGAEDAEVGKREGLPVLRTIDTAGNFMKDVPLFAGQNLFEANPAVAADLAKRGLLFKQEQYTHSYPFCWRCDTPLIYYALDSWFVKVTELKARMLKNNEQIHWIPEHIKAGRFAKGIESAPDWAVSRNRFWSVPIPIWECDACKHRACIGSVAELAELTGSEVPADLHRPGIDAVTWPCTKCDQGTMRRIVEVLDVWFDSGSMPYAQWHYPFENKELVDGSFPADFIAESIEMTRAWFYTLHVLATALKDTPAFKNVIGSGIIFGEDGNKLSKKLKNYPELDPTLKQYGADTVRLFFLSSTLGEPYVFSDKDLRQLHRQMYLTLWNVYSFFTRYARTAGWQPASGAELGSSNLLDRWITARLKELTRQVVTAADGYHIDQAARAFGAFIDDLSNWYVRRSRSRFHLSTTLTPRGERGVETRVNPANTVEDGGQPMALSSDSQAAFATLHHVLIELAKLLAPFMPFVTEAIFRNLTGRDSVHLENLPDQASAQAALTPEDTELIATMAEARAVVSEGLRLRAQAKLKVRQPLAELLVEQRAWQKLPKELIAIIAEEVNVHAVHGSDALPAGDGFSVSDTASEHRVALNTTLTKELKEAGIARELIRHGQSLRRQAKYALNDRIILRLTSSGPLVAEVLTTQRDLIQRALQADAIEAEVSGAEDASVTVTIAQEKIELGVHRP